MSYWRISSPPNVQLPSSTMKISAWLWACDGASKLDGIWTIWA